MQLLFRLMTDQRIRDISNLYFIDFFLVEIDQNILQFSLKPLS